MATKQKKYPLGDYGLSILLGSLFLVAWVVQTFAGWKHFVSEQRQHGETAKWLGDDGYLWEWLAATMENWQSEFLQLLTFVVFTTYFIHRKSHESRDSSDEMEHQLERIEQRLEQLSHRKEK